MRIIKKIMPNSSATYNRFERLSTSINEVQREVNILEEWLNVHPFPKFKHCAKYIYDLMEFIAIDLELEDYLRIVIIHPKYTDLYPGYIQFADDIADKLLERYGLGKCDGDYDEVNRKLESILQAQKNAEVNYKEV